MGDGSPAPPTPTDCEPAARAEAESADAGEGPAPAQGSSAPSRSRRPSSAQNGYSLFREMLKHPSAQPVTSQLLEFVRKFPSGLPRADAARRVHQFLSRTQEWMLAEIVVFAAEADEEGRTNAVEGLEKFLLCRLHERIFAVDPADAEEDSKLQRHVDALSWVGFQNLGVPPVEPSLLKLAVYELVRIDHYKAPRDKLVCILNACRVINDVLKRTIAESGASGRPLSADDFLPLLIYCVVAANPPRLHSNLEFVAAFRHPSRLVAEDAYFLTALQSAVAFVRDAGPKALDVTPEEFERLCAESLESRARDGADDVPGAATSTSRPLEQEAPGSPSSRGVARRQDSGSPPGRSPTAPAASTVAAKEAELSPALRQRLAERLRTLSFRFEGVPSAAQLRLKDVSSLLEEYRDMARLLREVEAGVVHDP